MSLLAPLFLAGLAALAVPIILLYEISILSVRYIERKRAKAQAADGADGGPEGDDPDDTPDSGPDVDSGGEETVEETDFNLDR